ncbi:hypothetical protein D8B46_03590 [Candidatus Gracilibacteria bacterium]|nr:MAG: hypothetical protein D8B46_03590 [Candidatus Gracilibacteria bacterium]
MFLGELKNFSKQNWWIYLLLMISIVIVYVTGKGNIAEILILFIANFLGNLFIMVMQSNYTSGDSKIGAIYHLSSTLIFTLISIYGLIYLGKYQYIIWQICYLIASIKAFTFYNFGKDIKIFNEYFLGALNVFLIFLYIYFGTNGLNIGGNEIIFSVGFEGIIMALGFSFVTTGLVSTKDKFRYWTNLVGIIFIIIGSLYGVVMGYFGGKIDGVSLGYFILTMTTFVFYLKLLKNYLK